MAGFPGLFTTNPRMLDLTFFGASWKDTFEEHQQSGPQGGGPSQRRRH